MAAGPALSQLHAHRAIHDGAQSGAVQFTVEMMELVKKGKLEEAKGAAKQLLEFWESRVISHADAEESGFYQKKAEENEKYQEAVIQLKRDHDILRMIVKDIKESLDIDGVSDRVIQQFHGLLTVNEIHSREEERLLFDK